MQGGAFSDTGALVMQAKPKVVQVHMPGVQAAKSGDHGALLSQVTCVAGAFVSSSLSTHGALTRTVLPRDRQSQHVFALSFPVY